MKEEIGISAENTKSQIQILRSQLRRGMAKVAKTKSGQGQDALYRPS